jgi:hypothetical protein
MIVRFLLASFETLLHAEVCGSCCFVGATVTNSSTTKYVTRNTRTTKIFVSIHVHTHTHIYKEKHFNHLNAVVCKSFIALVCGVGVPCVTR